MTDDESPSIAFQIHLYIERCQTERSLASPAAAARRSQLMAGRGRRADHYSKHQ